MSFQSVSCVLDAMKRHGVERLLVKPLAENDNSKQQIYLGKGFNTLNQLPFEDLKEVRTGNEPTVHASLEFSWLSSDGAAEPAKHAKLILYPTYPEVRLSGFLLGCRRAPSEFLKPITKEKRKFNNRPDGRFLILGVANSRKIFAVLALSRSPLAKDLANGIGAGAASTQGVFWEFAVPGNGDLALPELLRLLTKIRQTGPHSGKKLSADGVKPYQALNAGGLTLEALLGIMPNGKSEPDFKGWEIKSFGGDKITLMTPEPDGGVYATSGLEAFLTKYGYWKDNRLNFTGCHKAGIVQARSKLSLELIGFDRTSSKIESGGGLALIDGTGGIAASWSYVRLIDHWARKHNQAIYIPSKNGPVGYSYISPAILGEGTAFELFLCALDDHKVKYDPGSWLSKDPKAQKKRNQFRVARSGLEALYQSVRTVTF